MHLPKHGATHLQNEMRGNSSFNMEDTVITIKKPLESEHMIIPPPTMKVHPVRLFFKFSTTRMLLKTGNYMDYIITEK